VPRRLLNVLTSPPILADMAKKPEALPPQQIIWDLYRVASKLRLLGTAASADEAIEKAAKEFKAIASKLIAVPGR